MNQKKSKNLVPNVAQSGQSGHVWRTKEIIENKAVIFWPFVPNVVPNVPSFWAFSFPVLVTMPSRDLQKAQQICKKPSFIAYLFGHVLYVM